MIFIFFVSSEGKGLNKNEGMYKIKFHCIEYESFLVFILISFDLVEEI